MVSRLNEEKRKFMRMSVETAIKFTLINDPNNFYFGTSHDFSATGLYFTSNFSPNIGDEIEFTISPNSQKLMPFVAEATVLSCVVDKSNCNLFHVRVEISKIITNSLSLSSPLT